MATKPAEEPPGSLKYQTWVLKVSIHCEGCKKKVKKVLQSIEGVYTITIDSQLHKVTVTGNVEAETLLKKLLRSNKHAELWPEPKKGKKSKKNKQNGEADGENGDEAKNSTEKNQQADENGGDDADDDEGESDKEGGNQSNEAGGEQSVGAAGGGGGAKKKKKKKKKKGLNGNPPNGGTGNPGEHHGDAHPAGANGPPMVGPDMSHPMAAMNHGPPIQHMYPGPYPPPMYYQPPPAAYGLRYSTTYPSTSASYFTPAMHDNTYYQPDIYLPFDPVDSHTDDDDETSGCYIM
ncbi:PREDICTED: acidic proline-rich protein PRP33-like [Fragaria vesca subsp. vesca]|uniref:acidic proline-rich protein PRP33-like n=1 Tax=Fragaria vesca subsp. vesca TaxID=101020 RepID=UPI0002C30630|nr:PREDICTED: acidic proline-rich protein PRP33-like [Fragaria vesca subsp. vesca]